jgi:hypothetical protein
MFMVMLLPPDAKLIAVEFMIEIKFTGMLFGNCDGQLALMRPVNDPVIMLASVTPLIS